MRACARAALILKVLVKVLHPQVAIGGDRLPVGVADVDPAAVQGHGEFRCRFQPDVRGELRLVQVIFDACAGCHQHLEVGNPKVQRTARPAIRSR